MATMQRGFNRSEVRDRKPQFNSILIMASVLLLTGLLLLLWWYIQLPVGRSLTNDTIIEPLQNAERAIIELDVGAGSLHLQAGSKEQMIEGQVQTLAGIESLERTSTAENGAMVYNLFANAPNAIKEPAQWPAWNLDINPDVPLELNICGGMGASTVDLSQLSVTQFMFKASSGRSSISLPEQGKLNADIQGGSSLTTLYIPEGIPVDLTMHVQGSGHIEYKGRVFKRNAEFKSLAYDTASNGIQLNVTSYLGNVIIEQN